jgi:hypothetical protein
VPKQEPPRKNAGGGNPARRFRPAGRRLTRKAVFFAGWYAQFKEAKGELAIWTTPMRPIAHGGMSQAQLIDLHAAMEGKITWAEYFRKWGGGNAPSP